LKRPASLFSRFWCVIIHKTMASLLIGNSNVENLLSLKNYKRAFRNTAVSSRRTRVVAPERQFKPSGERNSKKARTSPKAKENVVPSVLPCDDDTHSAAEHLRSLCEAVSKSDNLSQPPGESKSVEVSSPKTSTITRHQTPSSPEKISSPHTTQPASTSPSRLIKRKSPASSLSSMSSPSSMSSLSSMSSVLEPLTTLPLEQHLAPLEDNFCKRVKVQVKPAETLRPQPLVRVALHYTFV